MVTRGCGLREEGGFYACVDMSPDGREIEYFIVDPALEFQANINLRAPFLLRDRNEVAHLVLGIGKTYYPFLPDFVEEARRHGVSKRIPVGYNLSALDPRRSALVLVHPRGIPNFEYHLNREYCPRKIADREDLGPHQCTGDLWDLSSVRSIRKRGNGETGAVKGESTHFVEDDEISEWVKIHTPSCSYNVMRAYYPNMDRMKLVHNYDRGIVLKFPRFHFEYVSKEGEAPRELEQRAVDSGYEFRVVDE